MKVIHITSNILLFAVGTGVVLLILASVVPIAAGGLAVDFIKDPEAVLEGENVRIEGEMEITSSLIWDITDFTYFVSIGNDNVTVAQSDPVMTDIPKGETTIVSFHMVVPVTSLALLMVKTGLSDDGIGDMNIPLSFGMSGAYIQGLVKFDLNVDMTVEMTGVSGSVLYIDAEKKLDIDVKYRPETDLSIPEASGTIKVGSNDAAGSFEISRDATGEYKFVFILKTNPPTELMDALRGNDVTIQIDEQYHTISGDDAEIMISLIEDILGKLGVAL